MFPCTLQLVITETVSELQKLRSLAGWYLAKLSPTFLFLVWFVLYYRERRGGARRGEAGRGGFWLKFIYSDNHSAVNIKVEGILAFSTCSYQHLHREVK